MMRLGFSTNAYTNGQWTLEMAASRIAKAGYGGVTILADEPLLWLSAMDFEERSAYAESLRKLLDKLGLYVTNVNGFTAQGHYGKQKGAPGQKFGPIFSDADLHLRAWKVRYTKLTIDFAARIGDAKNVSIGSGYAPRDVSSPEAWRWMVNAIRECVGYAEDQDVRLNIEPEPGLLVGNVEDAERLLSEIDSSHFGVNFDTGHFYAAGDDVPKAIRRLWPRIYSVDLEDIRATDIGRVHPDTGLPVHEHEVPGDGDMPLREILETFRDVGYQGWYTVELYNHAHHPEEVTDASFKKLKPLFEEVAQ